MQNQELSTLTLEWRTREGGSGRTKRAFLDFVIDGRNLSELVGGDLASCIGWFLPSENDESVKRLTLKAPADFLNNRRSLYVCPECGDLDCGAISVVIEQVRNTVIWRDFGYQNTYDAEIDFEPYQTTGPFIFDLDEYLVAIGTIPDKR